MNDGGRRDRGPRAFSDDDDPQPVVQRAVGKRTGTMPKADPPPQWPGKRSLTQGLTRGAAIQRKATGAASGSGNASAIAASGLNGASVTLPHLDAIQQSFGRHDVGGVDAHVGGDAAAASEHIGAKAYASDGAVAFSSQPDLHTAAHEAAHVVQQRNASIAPGIDRGPADPTERHADAVADAVVAGESAEALLDESAGPAPAVQRDTDPNSVDARKFLDQWWQSSSSNTSDLQKMLVDIGTIQKGPYAKYVLGSNQFATEFLTQLVARFPHIDSLIAPEPLLKLVDRARGLDWDQKDDDSQPFQTNVGPMMGTYWRPVAHELTNAIARHYFESIARIFPRVAKVFNRKNPAPPDKPKSDPASPPPKHDPVFESEILVSHPLDVVVSKALLQSQHPTYKIDFHGAAKEHPEFATAAENDVGQVALLREPGMYHWVNASPADATREQVAATLFGKPEDAYRLIAMPPYWGYRGHDVEAMVGMPRLSLWTEYTQDMKAGKEVPDDIGVALGVKHVDAPVQIDPVAELMNKGAAIAESQGKAGARAEQAKAGTAAKKHDEADIVALTSRNLKNLDDIALLVPLFGMSLDPVIAAQRAQSKRNTAAADTCLVDTETPYYLSEQQAGLLTGIALGLSATAGELVGGGGAAAPEAVRLPCAEVAEAYLGAIVALEVPEIARPRVAEADALQSNLKIAIQEATLHQSLAELNSQWNSPSLNHAQRVGNNVHLAHDDARARGDENMRRYTEQEDKLATARTDVRTNPAKANADVDALKPKVDDLGFEIGIDEKLDRLNQIWFAISGEEDFWENERDEDEGKKLKEENRTVYETFKTTVYDPFIKAQKEGSVEGKRNARKAYYELLQGNTLQDHAKKLRSFLERVHKHKKWKKFIVALVIAFVAFGLGQWTFGALVVEAGVFGAAVAAGVVTTGVTTILNKAILNQNPTAVGIITGFAFNVGTFFVVGKLAMAARAAAVETAAVEGTAQALSNMEGSATGAAGAADATAGAAGASTAAKVGKYVGGLAVETVIAEAIGLAQAEIEKLASHGRTLTWDEVGAVAVQQLIAVVGMRVASAATGDLFQYKSANEKLAKEIDLLAFEQGEIRAQAKQLSENARANPTEPNKAAAEALLERWRNYLERERVLREKILALAAKHPERFKAGDIAKLKAARRDPRLTQQLAEAEAILTMDQIGVNRFAVDPRGFDTLLAQHKSAGSEIESISTDARTGQRTVKLRPTDGGPAIELVENLAGVGERTAMKVPVAEARSFEAWLEGRDHQATKPPGQDQLRELYLRDPEAAINLAREKHGYKQPAGPETGVLVKADAPGETGKTPPTPTVSTAQHEMAARLGNDVAAIGNDRYLAPASKLKEIRAANREQKPSEIIYDPETNSSHFEVEVNGTKVRVEAMLEAPIQSFGNLDAATNRVVGRPVNADTGHSIMQRLSRGEGSALSEVGIAGEARMPADAHTEFGLGELANGDVVIIRGEKGAVDWSGLPGIKPKGHTHPDVPGNDLQPNAQTVRAEPLATLFDPRINPRTGREEPLLNRELILPSADDFIMMAQQAIDGHRVYSAFIVENGQIVKAPLGHKGPRLEFTMEQPREVGVLPDGRRVYRSTMEGHVGKDTPIREEIWTVQDATGPSGNLFMREPPEMIPIDQQAAPSKTPTTTTTKTQSRDPIPPTPGTKKFVEIPTKDLDNLHQRVSDHVKTTMEHIKDAPPDVAQKLTALGRAAAEDLYRLKVGTGMDPVKARKQAGDAAKKAIKDAAPKEAKIIAEARAERAIEDGTVFDLGEMQPDAKTQLENYKAGREGGLAKELAPQLAGKTMGEMEAILDFHVRQGSGTKTPQPGRDPTDPTVQQIQQVYEFTDGTLIRLKPRGDKFNPGHPMYSVEVKQVSPGGARDGQAGVAFKVNDRGQPVPKGIDEINNPYEKPKYEDQNEAFKNAVLAHSHQRAR